tara:strand:+ start:1449 stop:1772 length:324 start_codon:yes stop_codon:yes gene_type:complete
MKISEAEKKQFINLVDSFYNNETGLDPKIIPNLTIKKIATVLDFYLNKCASKKNNMTWGGGDSIDRERVRDILIYKTKYEPNFFEWVDPKTLYKDQLLKQKTNLKNV